MYILLQLKLVWIERMVYRVNLFLEIVSGILSSLNIVFFWMAVYRYSGKEVIGGYRWIFGGRDGHLSSGGRIDQQLYSDHGRKPGNQPEHSRRNSLNVSHSTHQSLWGLVCPGSWEQGLLFLFRIDKLHGGFLFLGSILFFPQALDIFFFSCSQLCSRPCFSSFSLRV